MFLDECLYILRIALAFIKAISPAHVPLAVIQRISLDIGEPALNIRVPAKIDIDGFVRKIGEAIERMRRYDGLFPQLQVPKHAVGHLARKRKNAIVPISEIAVELGIMEVGAKPRAPHFV